METYRIADIPIALTGDFGQYYQKRMEEYKAAGEKPEMVFEAFRECENIPMPEGEVIANINQRYWLKKKDGGLVSMDRIPWFSDQILNLTEADSAWQNIRLLTCKSDLIQIDSELRAFNMVGETMKYAILEKNGVFIHSSALCYHDQGVLFSAPSGTGKSTHTGLWKKYYPEETTIINDDMPAIRFIDGVPYVYGTPWSGKTDINTNIRVPLKAIVFITRGKNSIRRIAGAEAVWRLLDETRKPAVPELMQRNLDMLSKILSSVPAYLLSCDMSREAVETSKNILESE